MNDLRDEHMYVLDMLSYDVIEPLSSILNLLNNGGEFGYRDCVDEDFTREQVLALLRDLVRGGYVTAWEGNDVDDYQDPVEYYQLTDDADYEDIWFHREPLGTKVLWEWEPPPWRDEEGEADDRAGNISS